MRTWQASLTIILLVTGFLAVAQWRAGQPLRAQVELPTQRVQQLAVLLKQQEEARLALEAEIRQLTSRVQAYQRAVAEGRGAAETMAEEFAQLRLILRLTPGEGPGGGARVPGGSPPGGALPVQMRAADLAGLVNELWSAGAEAVAVNGVRILATTGVRDHADDILGGEGARRPPFAVVAIGEPLTLQTALKLRGGFVEGLRSIARQATGQRPGRIKLNAYRARLQFRYAQPAKTQ